VAHRTDPTEYLTTPPKLGVPPFAWHAAGWEIGDHKAIVTVRFTPEYGHSMDIPGEPNYVGPQDQPPWLAAASIAHRPDRPPARTNAGSMLAEFLRIPWQKERTEEAQDRIATFADKYGFLGQGFSLRNTAHPHLTDYGESLTQWRWQRRVIGLCENLRTLIADTSRLASDKLEELIQEPGRDDFTWRPAAGLRWPDGPDGPFLWEFNTGYTPPPHSTASVREAARHILDHIVNRKLHDLVRPQVVLERGQPVQMVPHCLLGALYAQVAIRALGGLPPLRFCQWCGDPIGGEHRHRDVEHCSPRCVEAHKMEKRKLRRAQVRAQTLPQTLPPAPLNAKTTPHPGPF
jgi:predicted nucleic acid-binding Zn ribbon protein